MLPGSCVDTQILTHLPQRHPCTRPSTRRLPDRPLPPSHLPPRSPLGSLNWSRLALRASPLRPTSLKKVSRGKHTRTFIVILAPVVTLPPGIEKQFIVFEHELPSREQLQDIATGIAQGDELPTGDDLARVLASTAGDTIEALRQWASGRCLSADRAGVYLRGRAGWRSRGIWPRGKK